MELKQFHLNTFIPTIPFLLNSNFSELTSYISNFYDIDASTIVAPINTEGYIKGAKGEFNQLVVDTLIVKNSTNISNNAIDANKNLDLVNNLHSNALELGILSPDRTKCNILVDRYYYNIIDFNYVYKFNATKIGTTICVSFVYTDPNSIARITAFNINQTDENDYNIAFYNRPYIIAYIKMICINIVNGNPVWSIINVSPDIAHINISGGDQPA